MKRMARGAAVLSVAALALAACGEPPEETGTGEGDGETLDYKACMVSDAGGFDDKSFNQAAFEGLTQAEAELGVEAVDVESTADTDLRAEHRPAWCRRTATSSSASASCSRTRSRPRPRPTRTPTSRSIDTRFSAPDFSPVELENGKPILFDTAQASFLAGYLAAGMSQDRHRRHLRRHPDPVRRHLHGRLLGRHRQATTRTRAPTSSCSAGTRRPRPALHR